jgi:hypothetical protein
MKKLFIFSFLMGFSMTKKNSIKNNGTQDILDKNQDDEIIDEYKDDQLIDKDLGAIKKIAHENKRITTAFKTNYKKKKFQKKSNYEYIGWIMAIIAVLGISFIGIKLIESCCNGDGKKNKTPSSNYQIIPLEKAPFHQHISYGTIHEHTPLNSEQPIKSTVHNIEQPKIITTMDGHGASREIKVQINDDLNPEYPYENKKILDDSFTIHRHCGHKCRFPENNELLMEEKIEIIYKKFLEELDKENSTFSGNSLNVYNKIKNNKEDIDINKFLKNFYDHDSFSKLKGKKFYIDDHDYFDKTPVKKKILHLFPLEKKDKKYKITLYEFKSSDDLSFKLQLKKNTDTFQLIIKINNKDFKSSIGLVFLDNQMGGVIFIKDPFFKLHSNLFAVNEIFSCNGYMIPIEGNSIFHFIDDSFVNFLKTIQPNQIFTADFFEDKQFTIIDNLLLSKSFLRTFLYSIKNLQKLYNKKLLIPRIEV